MEHHGTIDQPKHLRLTFRSFGMVNEASLKYLISLAKDDLTLDLVHIEPTASSLYVETVLKLVRKLPNPNQIHHINFIITYQ